MYTFNLELVTKVKIASESWQDPAIQEISYAYTRIIRNLMLFKGIMFGYCGLYLQNQENQQHIALISFGFDFYMLANMLLRLMRKSPSPHGQGEVEKEGKDKKQKNMILLPPTTAALIVQSLLTGSYLLCYGMEYFQFIS